MLTDSGGFQVFSLSSIRKLREEGAEFRSHIDGSKHVFTPEKVMDIERTIGADIMMAFDECPPGTSDYQYAKKSLGLTHRWLDRCIKRFNETEPKYGYHQALFPIVQGCVYPDLRKQSAEFVASKEAEGNAIGGLAVGEPVEKMYEMIEVVNEILPKDKPRYLMGVGTPVNILEGIERGVDMKYVGVEANIVALSGIAIAIGVMVDIGVVFVESIIRRLEEEKDKGVPKGKALAALIYSSVSEVSGALSTAMQRETKFMQDSNKEKYTNTLNTLEAELYKTRHQLDDATRKIALYGRQEQLAQSAYGLIIREYISGKSDLNNVIQLERQLLDYQLKKSEAVAGYNTMSLPRLNIPTRSQACCT